MRAAQLTVYGSTADVIKTSDISQPAISDNHLIVEVHTAGVNPVDWKIREGYMKEHSPLSLPVTMGGDFSGVVTEIGNGVSGFSAGDEVYGTSLVLGGGSGAFAEMTSAKSTSIAKKPTKISFKEAAAIPLVGVSAIQALTEHIQLASGQKILIHGGAGGIGSMAIQIAKHIGAYVATTVGTNDVAYAKDLGADEVIDYKTQKFEEMLHDFDAVYDTVGGDTYKHSFKVLKKGGMIVSMTEQPDQELMHQYDVTAIAQFTQINTERLNKLTELVDAGVLTVHIEKEFSLDQAGEALVFQQTGHPRGKVLITIQ